MSALLDAVSAAREARDAAQAHYREVVRKAREHHSLSELARAAGITRSGVQHLLRSDSSRDEKT